MKRCPACQRVYSDETIKFCRVDGAILVADSIGLDESQATRALASRATNEAPTEVLPSDALRTTTGSLETPAEPSSQQVARRRAERESGIKGAGPTVSSAAYVVKQIKGRRKGVALTHSKV